MSEDTVRIVFDSEKTPRPKFSLSSGEVAMVALPTMKKCYVLKQILVDEPFKLIRAFYSEGGKPNVPIALRGSEVEDHILVSGIDVICIHASGTEPDGSPLEARLRIELCGPNRGGPAFLKGVPA